MFLFYTLIYQLQKDPHIFVKELSKCFVKYIEQSFALNAAAESELFSSPWWMCEPVTKEVFWRNIYEVNTIDVTNM